MLVLTKESFIEEQIRNTATKKVKVFYGSRDDNLKATDENQLLIPESEILVKMKTPNYKNSEAYEEHWRDINNLRKKIGMDPQNIAHTPADLNTLIQLYIMDITRQTMEQIDYTARLTIENTDYNYPQSISLRDLFPYTAKFKEISAAGDRLPLVKQTTGEIRSILMHLYGAGWVCTLHNLLFNSLYSMQKVMDAISKSYILERNDMTLGRMFALSAANLWHASQRQPAINATGNTIWENLYDTIQFAIEQLRGLRDPQNHKLIPVSSIVFLCHSTQLNKCRAVISGALEKTGSQQGRGMLRGPLDISEIWTYDGDSYTWGLDPITFAGCATDKAYVFVPRSVWYTAVKRPLTMEVGRGDTLSLSQEERAWYFCQTSYPNDFFGSSMPGATTTGEGFIIEIDLPTVVEET